MRDTWRVVASGLMVFLFGATSVPLHAQKGTASPAQGAGGQAQGGATPYFETVMLAHGALNELAEAVAQRICNAAPPVISPHATVIIYDQQSFQNLGVWQSFATGAELLADAYKTLPVPQPVAGPPAEFDGLAASTAGAPFIQGGADLGSLISAIAASTTNTASSFTIPDSTMAVSLLHQFERINCDAQLVYYPIFGSYTNKNSAAATVRDALQNLNEARRNAQNNWAYRTVDAATDYTYDASKNNVYAELNDLNNQYDLLLKAFLSMPGQTTGTGGGSGGGGGAQSAGSPGAAQNSGASNGSATNASPGAVSLLQGAELEQLIEKDDAYILYADVVAAGGTQRDIKNVFTLITGDWLSYSGGAVVNIAFIKSKETRLQFSDTLRYRTDFHHRDLWDILGFRTFSVPQQSNLVEKVNAGSNVNTLCNQGRRRQQNPPGPCAVELDALSVTRAFLTFDETEVPGGKNLKGRVTLTANTPVALNVTLLSGNAALVPNNAPVIIPANKRSQDFDIPTAPVMAQTPVVISVLDPENTLHSQLIQLSPRLLSLNLFGLPAAIGGDSVSGNVVLPYKAPKGGIIVRLFSSDPAVAALSSPFVQFGEGDRYGAFTISTAPVVNPTRAVISASFDSVSESELLMINP
jgi:hypothetical protein